MTIKEEGKNPCFWTNSGAGMKPIKDANSFWKHWLVLIAMSILFRKGLWHEKCEVQIIWDMQVRRSKRTPTFGYADSQNAYKPSKNMITDQNPCEWNAWKSATHLNAVLWPFDYTNFFSLLSFFFFLFVYCLHGTWNLWIINIIFLCVNLGYGWTIIYQMCIFHK